MIKQVNFRLLLGLLVAVMVGTTAVIVVHSWRIHGESLSLLTQADQAEDAGDVAASAEYLKRYMVYRPDDAAVLERYGRLLNKRAQAPVDKQRVLAVYEQVLSLEPSRDDIRRTAVDLAMEQGDFDRANEHLDRLVAHDPGNGELADLHGQCREALGQPGNAAASYRAAVGLSPNRIDVYVRLARLLRGPLGQPDDADQLMDDLVTANPGSPTAYVERAVYRAANGSFENAEKDAVRARELAPEDVRVIQTSAALDARLGREDAARVYLSHGVQLHPDDVALRLALAKLELKAGEPDKAAACLDEGRKRLADTELGPDGARNCLACWPKRVCNRDVRETLKTLSPTPAKTKPGAWPTI